ncbi:type I-C CRISPR-associated protein Cas8c/Csd1 [Acidocella aquatica]|uniref:Type I-C CRISPR-associated protein Cas8c/Csd1 n=1 Tax=Acidocella aquatica TaxID=1922313 RepID=A0ABQ6A569_9PROT|nr:type I-C CRISPR-associated protein Cas8c/Csd1 [Acidocella aquatica]GLR66420.1 type I-C CRISPR-associated protein Cas8c/Csd1 [Acidocella aquatica]
MTVLHSLDKYYDRLASRGDVVPPGYSVEPIGFVIELNEDGTVANVSERRDPSGKRAKLERLPKWFGRQGQGSTPFLLWDNTGYALGVTKKTSEKVLKDVAAFKALHLNALADQTDIGLVALRNFVEKWTPEAFVEPLFQKSFIDQNLAFKLVNESRLLHERPAAIQLIERLRQPKDSDPVFCLVTGRHEAGVRLHPKIKGVDDTSVADVPLVSFNENAFWSYGKEQGRNAPTSEAAAFRYGAALNRLLDRQTGNRLKIADATVTYWADAEGVGEAAAAEAENLFGALMEPPSDTAEAEKIRNVLAEIAKGRPLTEIDPKLEPTTRFHILGLSPNAARLSVRYWMTDEFGKFAEKLARHYEDISIEPAPWGGRLPSIRFLLIKTTALMEKPENVPPHLAGEVTRAVLEGLPYPRTMLTAAIMRLRAGDPPHTGWHAAIIKACINRSAKTEKEKLPVARDPDNEYPAYQLGRLFAVLEAAQYAALGRVNASIVDRYYGAASATPARVFGPLLRNVRNHVSDATKRGKGKWIEARLNEIMSKLDPNLPKTLKLEDQGRFAVGYYHERAWRGPGQPDIETLDIAEEETK